MLEAGKSGIAGSSPLLFQGLEDALARCAAKIARHADNSNVIFQAYLLSF